jgi:hypothetical protein
VLIDLQSMLLREEAVQKESGARVVKYMAYTMVFAFFWHHGLRKETSFQELQLQSAGKGL